MANGFLPYLLLTSKAVFQGNTPCQKITPPGYLRMLLEQSRPNIVSQSIDDGSGHIRDVKIKFRTRRPVGLSQDDDNCDVDARPAYSEDTISSTLFKKTSFFLDDDTIARYEKEASAQVKTINGIPQLAQITPMMKEQWDIVMEFANGLIGDINIALLAKQVANFGFNQTTGSAAAKTVNFLLSNANNDLSTGMPMLISDMMENEIKMSDVTLVGSGLINNYYIQQPAKSADQSGVNTSQLALPKLYHDLYAGSAWGANQFGVFEKNSAQFVDIVRFTGFKAGMKPGTWLGSLPLPIVDSQGNTFSLTVDVQIKYIDCPQEIEVGYPVPATVSVGRGWVIILSKSFDQFNIPATSYDAADRLFQNNGTLRYEATNV
jgi:hypothetical protein